MKNILIVDDEQHILELLKFNLRKEGYNTFEADSGILALEILKHNKVDLVILDIMMSDKDGYEVLKEIRFNKDTKNLPVILLSAKSEEIDKILGLELGADDYITKPFSVKELVVRVKALLRRVESLRPEVEDKVKFGDIEVDFSKRTVKKNNQDVSLSFKEFELLKLLIENRGRVLDRDFILQRVWGYEFDGDTRTVDVHIRFLRRKLEDDEKNPRYIETVRGVGYRFNERSE
ncbi:two-component system alkaline phosphatase synthesis response regulator PhoP [Caldicellulosiruptor bescii]|uniref:Two component transcriptional regulator, winged helix family n=2 Tax=Caldicellulosiruptor bescii TaxID=31899 RepID=B9MJS7_CALBD|nr:response regulator transcription factor [Caldicellulosiruptor bescii]ACM60585.1 two component transcriptional regulator, winged helix family [Caldicellulosiruptor bescii DSM 6725]PBC87996.1 two-component system alkaline phosphatase synthesis response regulator PhoP [Caldicellulosiruptor bescii]PBC90928.1 two-component system alkaline phosphatase synthesis response regulator PhoP [Caldicellulosiruptor bescii]PBD03640.1 two-component system alkaline phosphatase synthesis response regulator Pho